MSANDSGEGRNLPQVYTLTSLTRSSGQSRRVVLAGFDVPLRGMVVTVLASLMSIPVVSIMWVFMGSVALIFTAVFVAAAFLLVEGRSRKGLQLRLYQSIIDQKRENLGRFISCGMEVHPNETRISTIVPASVAAPTPARTDDLDQVDMLLGVEHTSKEPSTAVKVPVVSGGTPRRGRGKRGMTGHPRKNQGGTDEQISVESLVGM